MKTLLIAAVVAFVFAGCDTKEAEPRPAPTGDTKTGPAGVISDAKSAVGTAVAATQDLEVGCAKCTYALPGVTSCGTAVKVGAKAYAVNVPGFDAHAEHLCEGAKRAKVTGEMKDGKFVASKIELLK